MAKRRPRKSLRTQALRTALVQAELWASAAKEGGWPLVELEIKRALRSAHLQLEEHFEVLRPFTREFGLAWLRLFTPLYNRRLEAAAGRRPEKILAVFQVPDPILLCAWTRWLQERQQQFARRYPESVLRRMARLAREISSLPFPEELKQQIKTLVQSEERTVLTLRVCVQALRPFWRRKSRDEALKAAVIRLVRTMKALGWSEYRAVKFISTRFPEESFEALKARVRRARLNGSA